MAETEVMAPKRRGSSSTFMGLEQALVLQPLLSDCRVLLILVEEDLNSSGITEISVFFAIVSKILLFCSPVGMAAAFTWCVRSTDRPASHAIPIFCIVRLSGRI